ncbi:chemotaxis protein CheW [Undibacterium sp. TJN19]|uniref:chemotaxis protein CheW n=1 Tax=Undibacterium sp. TJN19 TaxID=3413055 RepID=UPI003BF17500
MSNANAWLLEVGDGRCVAIGQRELIQIIDAPDSFDVPLAPAHMREVIFWQKRVVPVMQLPLRLGGQPCKGNILALVAFHDADSKTAGLGAIHLSAPPSRVVVDDRQASNLEDDNPVWQDLAIACFEQDGKHVPVLDLSRIFCGSVN